MDLKCTTNDGVMEFVRYGNLNTRKHKEHRNGDTFHTAPRFRGIYAFPKRFEELFLLGGVDPDGEINRMNRRVEYLRDELGNRIRWSDYCNENTDEVQGTDMRKLHRILKRRGARQRDLSSSNDGYVTVVTNRHVFEYDGPVWHHLTQDVPRKDILLESGSWVLTDIRTYENALKRSDGKERFESSLGRKHSGDRSRHKNYYSKDHYEVFIEHIK